MAHFDVFNGDADGICALVQLRLAEPKQSTLVTGVKRDIKLLAKLDAKAGDSVTALDISMDKNSNALSALLANDVSVFYCDHHFAGDIPMSSQLTAIIDTSPTTCTSLLINEHLNGAYPNWAIVAAYGDNMTDAGDALAAQQHLSPTQKAGLKALGIAINYNGYGANLSDLHFAPADLFKQLLPFSDPLTLVEQAHPIYTTLLSNYQQDMAHTKSAKLMHESTAGKVFVLPNETWARRISGVWGNDLANQAPDIAHAVLTELAQGGYLVSVRAPKRNPVGADELCRQFVTGGGRKAAAGINELAQAELATFAAAFDKQFLA